MRGYLRPGKVFTVCGDLLVEGGQVRTLSRDFPQNPHRCMAMPTRHRTRAADRRARIEYERGLNYQEYLLRPQPDPEPPPF